MTSNEEDKNTSNNDANAPVEITDVADEVTPNDNNREVDIPKDSDGQDDGVVPIEEGKKSSHSTSDSHTAGNPIFMIVLALISVFIGLRRKF